MIDLLTLLKGGRGSGDWGHVGRAGKRGGSGGGGGKGKLRRGRRSREALDKEIEARKKKEQRKSNVSNGKVTDDVRNLREDRNIQKLYDNFDAHKANEIEPDSNTVAKISKSSGTDSFDVDNYMREWNGGAFLDTHFVSQSAVRSLGAKYSPYEDSKRRSWERMLDAIGPGRNEDLKSDYDKIAKAVYNETQGQLKEMGVEEVILYRGMNSRKPGLSKGDVADYVGNSLDSWTTDLDVAKQFASADINGFVMKSSIPASRIFSMSSSGPGTSGQREMIILGTGSNDEVLIAWDK